MNFICKCSTLKEAGELIGVTFQVVSHALLKSKTHKCRNYYVFREEQDRQRAG